MKPPKKPKNTDQRTREFLSVYEIEIIRRQARKNPLHGHRNDTLILMMFKHALRVSEAIDLQWEQVDFNLGKLYVNRLKNGRAAEIPFPIHPHMLRHSTGFYLANKGIDTRTIQQYGTRTNR